MQSGYPSNERRVYKILLAVNKLLKFSEYSSYSIYPSKLPKKCHPIIAKKNTIRMIKIIN